MRALRLLSVTFLCLTALAACGGSGSSSKKAGSTSSTTTPLPTGCPPQTILNIETAGGTVKVAAATRKAVVRKNFITVYLFSKLVQQSPEDFKKYIGSSFRIDGTGAMIADGKNASGATPTTGTYVPSTKAPLQLVGYSVQQDNKLMTAKPAKPADSARLEITHFDPTLVCGKISGPEGNTTFIADRIDA